LYLVIKPPDEFKFLMEEKMKTVVRLMLVALLLVVALPLTSVSAQDNPEDTLVAAPELSAVYYLSAASGSFADQGDGTYLLTLEGVGPEIVWLASYPGLRVYRLSTENLAINWGAGPEGLSADAVLETAGLNIQMLLSSPTYDATAGTQSYVASVVNIITVEDTKEPPELPATFDNAALSIAWTVEFENGLVAGIQVRYEGLRATPEECAAALQSWNDYVVWDQQKAAEQAAAQLACSQGDAAACTTANNIAQERKIAGIRIYNVKILLATQCR
jgi:hypothetical protein